MVWLMKIVNSKKKAVYYGYGQVLRYTFDISSFNECYIYMGKIYVHIQNCTNITLRPMGNLQVNLIHFLKKKYLIYLENK